MNPPERCRHLGELVVLRMQIIWRIPFDQRFLKKEAKEASGKY